MMAGANPAAVQRIMRHSDPRLTTEVYGHLAPEYLQAEINRLRFQPAATRPLPEDENDTDAENGAIEAAAIAGGWNGGRRGYRTPDPLRVKQLLYH